MTSAAEILARPVAQFTGARAVEPSGHPSVCAVLEAIRSPSARVADLVASIRNETDTARRRELKATLPALCFAADLHHRRGGTGLADRVASLSGIVCLDLDHLEKPAAEVRDLVAQDLACLAAFVSPSGDGVKVLYAIQSPSIERWPTLWHAAADRLRDRFGLECDPARKDLVGLCFASHDPGAFIRSGSLELIEATDPVQVAPLPWVEPETPRGPRVSDSDLERRALAYVRAMPSSVQGSQGSGSMVAVVRALADGFALCGADLLRVLNTWNSERASPPWSASELQHAIQSVANTPPKRPRGWLRDSPLLCPGRPTGQPDAPDGTEAALAAFLAGSDLCNRLRWAPEGWHEWNGKHWAITAEKVPLALQVAIRRALADGLEAENFDGKMIPRLESFGSMRGVGNLLAAWPSMKMPPETDPPGLIACPRGVLDLKTGEWLAHDPARFITKICPIDPGPSCPFWELIERHLQTCLGKLYKAVHRHLGACLLGLGSDRRLLWLHGPGNDGKSTLAKCLRKAIGEYASTVNPESFTEGGTRDAHGHELASCLAGVRLGIGLEIGPRPDWDHLKSLTGSDEQTTKRLGGRRFTFERPPVLMLVSNFVPVPPDRASAERLIVAGMQPPDDPDERLMVALKTPGPEQNEIAAACLSWLIAGCRDYQTEGLGPVPLCGFQSTGLARWWEEGTKTGRLIPNAGQWTPLERIRADLDASGTLFDGEKPHDRDLSSFLKSVVEYKRTKTERLYRLGLVTHGDTSR